MEQHYLTFDEIVPVVGISSEEKETTIVMYNSQARLWTCDNTVITKVRKLVRDNPKDYKAYVGSYNMKGEPTGYFVEFPDNLITFRTTTRTLTEEQREAAAERMRIFNGNRNGNS